MNTDFTVEAVAVRKTDTRSTKYQNKVQGVRDPAITKSLNADQLMKYYQRRDAKLAREREEAKLAHQQKYYEWEDKKFSLEKDEARHLERVEMRKKKEQDKKLRKKANANLALEDQKMIDKSRGKQ